MAARRSEAEPDAPVRRGFVRTGTGWTGFNVFLSMGHVPAIRTGRLAWEVILRCSVSFFGNSVLWFRGRKIRREERL
jgi:hypothetical protein